MISPKINNRAHMNLDSKTLSACVLIRLWTLALGHVRVDTGVGYTKSYIICIYIYILGKL